MQKNHLVSIIGALLVTFAGLARGQIFVADLGFNNFPDPNGYGRVAEYDSSGATLGPFALWPNEYPAGLAISGNRVYVYHAESDGSGTVDVYTTDGVMVHGGLITGIDSGYICFGIAVSGDNIYIVNYSKGTIGKYTTSGATVNASLISGLNIPTGLAVSGTNLFVANRGRGTIAKYSTFGTALNTNLVSGLYIPWGVAVSGNDLFVVNDGGWVGKYTTSGATVNSSLISGLHEPVGLAIDGTNLYVGIFGDGTVAQYTTFGDSVDPVLISGLNSPYGVAIVMAPPPPSFLSVAKANNAVLLTWSAVVGRNYQLQFTVDLSAGNWANLGSPILATSSIAASSDPAPPDRRRFYRVLAIP